MPLLLIRSWECGEVGHYVVEVNCDDYFDLEYEPSVHSTIHGEKIRYLCSVTKSSSLRIKRGPIVAKATGIVDVMRDPIIITSPINISCEIAILRFISYVCVLLGIFQDTCCCFIGQGKSTLREDGV